MRLALLATLFLVPFFSTPAAAQSANYAYAAPHAVRGATLPPVARAPVARTATPAPRPLVSRADVGITSAWPTSPADFADYAAHEIEAGTVSDDLYVRWYAFNAHARTFTVELSLDGGPFQTAARVATSQASGDENGVHLLGLAPGLYEVRVVERESTGTNLVSTSVRVRV